MKWYIVTILITTIICSIYFYYNPFKRTDFNKDFLHFSYEEMKKWNLIDNFCEKRNISYEAYWECYNLSYKAFYMNEKAIWSWIKSKWYEK